MGRGEFPTPWAIEAVAEALEFDPMGVAEYRMAAARRQLDPSEVGLDAALEALEAFELSRGAGPSGEEGEQDGLRMPGPPADGEIARRAQAARTSEEDPAAAPETWAEGTARKTA